MNMSENLIDLDGNEPSNPLYNSIYQGQMIKAQNIELDLEIAQTDIGKVVYTIAYLIPLSVIVTQNPMVAVKGYKEAVISGLENKYLADGNFADGYIGGAVSGIISEVMRMPGIGDAIGTLAGTYLTNVLNGDTSADALGKSLEPALWSSLFNSCIDVKFNEAAKILPDDISGKTARIFLNYVGGVIDKSGSIISGFSPLYALEISLQEKIEQYIKSGCDL